MRAGGLISSWNICSRELILTSLPQFFFPSFLAVLTQESLLMLRVRQPNLNTFSNHGKILFAHIWPLTERKDTTNTVSEDEPWDGVNALPHGDPYLAGL